MAGFLHHHSQCCLPYSLSSCTTPISKSSSNGTLEAGVPQDTGTLRCLNRAFGNHLHPSLTEHKVILQPQKPRRSSGSNGRKMGSSQKTTYAPCQASPQTQTAASAAIENQTSPSPYSATSKKSPSTNRTSRASKWKTQKVSK